MNTRPIPTKVENFAHIDTVLESISENEEYHLNLIRTITYSLNHVTQFILLNMAPHSQKLLELYHKAIYYSYELIKNEVVKKKFLAKFSEIVKRHVARGYL